MKIYLISEDTIKSNSILDANIYGKFLGTAITETQDMYLSTIIGTPLMNKLYDLVASGEIANEENSAYKLLLDNYIQPVLLYGVQTSIIPLIANKVANAGVLVTNDEKNNNVDRDDVVSLTDFFRNKRDFYTEHLQTYLCKNSTKYPEYGENEYGGEKGQTYSHSDCCIWLGGYRGKIME